MLARQPATGSAATCASRSSTVAELVDQIRGQPCESPVGIRRSGPGERHPRRLRLGSQFFVEIPHHFDVVGDEPDGADDDSLGARGGQRRELVGDIGLQPGHLRRTRSGLPGQVVIGVPGGRRDQPCGISDLAAVQTRAAPLIGRHRNRMRGEYQPGIGAHGGGGRGDALGEHLHQKRMVEVGSQLYQLGRIGTCGPPGAGDVFDVLCAAGIPAPG